ncbi:MAG: hypothetical protein ACRD11_12205 [Terriglobia bacterium]
MSPKRGSGKRYVFVDPKTGDLVIRYPTNLGLPDFAENPGPQRAVRVVLPNHVDPLVSAHVTRDLPYDEYHYQYSLENGPAARQRISDWVMIVPHREFVREAAQPEGWSKGLPLTETPPDPRAAWYVNPPGFTLFWCSVSDPPWTAAIGPRATLAGFAISGPARPGFLRNFFFWVDLNDPTRDMPNEVAVEARPYMTLVGSSQERLLLGPAFPLDTPKNVISSRLLDSVREMIKMRELDAASPFVRESMTILDQFGATNAESLSAASQRPVKFKTQPNGEMEKQLYSAITLDLE